MVTADERDRLLAGSAARRDFADEVFRVGFESEDSMDSLNFSLLLADTTGR
jgi:hypothetical protein